ncbi:MAG: TraR/DksA C4-type zinc finger protein [Proteobacteria bacterium]|nr:TraR/DksA C4-type zinc finger protein [Pseudomonadota bacterium]MBU2226160.1 TraR/DksA C4-type zinc finger protein [Pseudomonadota bacterium]MBU2260522.1 TraR/DksA C4-type zinc finger protein [Pseudomonadota bacterium]
MREEIGENSHEVAKKAGDYQRCVAFHGHDCPGLAIGYRAAKAGLAFLREDRAEDEGLVAIVETDACGSDAVQVLTGCTFGKGNFIYRDHGKNVYTLLDRKSGRGVRVALQSGVMDLNERHRQLIEKMRKDAATQEERREFWELHRLKSLDILKKPLEALFLIRTANPQLPPKVRMEPSRLCACCGEPTMGSKLVEFQGKDICRDCQEKTQKVNP